MEMTNEIFVSDAPCAQAITLMPFLPRVPKSFPAMPGVCFMFSPTIATVARFLSCLIRFISPILISWANSSERTCTARSASPFLTPMDVVFSDAACDTRKTLMPDLARVLKIR